MTESFLSVRIPNALAQALAKDKATTGCPTSVTVRRALECWLDPFPCKWCLANYVEPKEEQSE
jgi:hypothetical protein